MEIYLGMCHYIDYLGRLYSGEIEALLCTHILEMNMERSVLVMVV